MLSLLSLLKKRRSIRVFKEKKVELEKIQEIIEAALLSPSSKNNNPWKFIVVEDKEILTKLSQAKEHGTKLLKKAPLAIAILADPEQSDVWIEDASIATTLIMIMASYLGLGSCWIQIRKRYSKTGQNSEEYVKDLLKIPDSLRVLCLMAIGYPDEIKANKEIPKEKWNDVFLNQYNNKLIN